MQPLGLFYPVFLKFSIGYDNREDCHPPTRTFAVARFLPQDVDE